MPFYIRFRIIGPIGWSHRIGPRKRRTRPGFTAMGKPVYHGEDGDWQCPHRHRTPEAAQQCADRHIREVG